MLNVGVACQTAGHHQDQEALQTHFLHLHSTLGPHRTDCSSKKTVVNRPNSSSSGLHFGTPPAIPHQTGLPTTYPAALIFLDWISEGWYHLPLPGIPGAEKAITVHVTAVR